MSIKAILQTSDRAFANLYDISIIRNTGAVLSPTLMFRAEDINFGGEFSIETFYSEATKQHFLTNANRVKTISISFRETAQYEIMGIFRSWQGSIFQQSINAFLPGNPTGTINIFLDPDDFTKAKLPDGRSAFIYATGVIPTSIQMPTYSYKEGNPLITSVTFSVDTIDFTIPKVNF